MEEDYALGLPPPRTPRRGIALEYQFAIEDRMNGGGANIALKWLPAGGPEGEAATSTQVARAIGPRSTMADARFFDGVTVESQPVAVHKIGRRKHPVARDTRKGVERAGLIIAQLNNNTCHRTDLASMAAVPAIYRPGMYLSATFHIASTHGRHSGGRCYAPRC